MPLKLGHGMAILSLVIFPLFAMAGPSRYDEPYPPADSKKGLQVEMVDDAVALGIKHAAINVNLSQLVQLDVGDGPGISMNGRDYHFSRDALESLDRRIKPLSDRGIVINLIILVYAISPEVNRVMLHPEYDPGAPNRMGAFNTVTDEGRGWFLATMKFLAERWSRPDQEYGRVAGYIIGNEVNAHWFWSNMGRVSMHQFADDYLRTVRLAHGVIREISSWARVYVSLEHHWNSRYAGGDEKQTFAARPFLEYFASRARDEGDFDWHVAFHPYPENLFEPRFWNDKTALHDRDAPRVTFKNLEVLIDFLGEESMQYEGQRRRVILSEQGFHTPEGPGGEMIQAAAYCYAYKIVEGLEHIDSFILHRHVDHPREGGLLLGLRGLRSEGAKKKKIYDCFRLADTPEWRGAFEFALPLVGLTSWKNDREPSLTVSSVSSSTAEKDGSFLDYIRHRAAALQANVVRPSTLEEWNEHRRELRQRLGRSWGAFPETPCPLNPKKLGEIEREGYRIEKVVFQTMPDIWMTANAYVPEREGKLPAVLCVHGHLRGAKQDRVVQSRCIGLARQGFFVLAVDAFGAGERGVGKALGEYHGELVAATLIPTGRLLAGLQVYENTRAVDYLESRPEVDPERLGITGTSGGGNQTMYAGAWDRRFDGVVPVCSVGNYQAYLGVACCLCETIPGALRYTEEEGVLAMVAPRALMVINATRDSIQFSVGEAKKSIAGARPIFDLHGRAKAIRHVPVESGHAYNQEMREAMYGWMKLHLQGEGDGQALAEPVIETMDPEVLRCYPGETRPDDWTTLPQLAARIGRSLVDRIAAPTTRDQFEEQARAMRSALSEDVFTEKYRPGRPVLKARTGKEGTIEFEPEPHIRIHARIDRGTGKGTAIVLDVGGCERAASSPLAGKLRENDWTVVTIDLRATGRTAPSNDAIGSAVDHNSAQWSLWTGRTLLEQWVWDVRCTLDVLTHQDPELAENVTVVGIGPAGLVATVSAALDPRIEGVVMVNTLASYVTAVRYENQRVGTLVPGILRDVGDIPHLAALVAPRSLIIAGGGTGGGEALVGDKLEKSYEVTKRAYRLVGAVERLAVLSAPDDSEIVSRMTRPGPN